MVGERRCIDTACRAGLLGKGIAPVLKARSAEAWVEWSLPGALSVVLKSMGQRSFNDFSDVASTLLYVSRTLDLLAGKEDVEQILDDLGSLSDPGRMAQTGPERWRWLQPWTWILGVWGPARPQADFVLDVTVRGRGLETCSAVQVCTGAQGLRS